MTNNRSESPAEDPIEGRAGGVLGLLDRLRAIGEAVPLEEWNKLPPDFAANLDYYLYDAQSILA